LFNELLNEVVQLTSHKDLEPLDHNLVKVLARLASADRIELIHFHTDKKNNTLANILQVAYDAKKDVCLSQCVNDSEISRIVIDCIKTHSKAIGSTGGKDWHFILPIKINGSFGACVCITSVIEPALQGDTLVNVVNIYANHLRMIHESERDELTNLLNRKSFDSRIERLLNIQKNEQLLRSEAEPALDRRKAFNEDKNAWLAIIDIDHFKQVNDAYGHIYGDEVLLRLSQLLQLNFRHSDLVFRFGGEEFIIVLAPVNAKDAETAIERFRHNIEQLNFPRVGKITVSIGYAELGVDDYPPLVIEQADSALYYAKEHGRNKIFRYETLIENGSLSRSDDESLIELF